ncbi:MAG: tetratricopeptide repeat protein [Bacteroidetes bacterium]|nr:tetratricopeptide repeat protein [Bacteroidota bacterium]
MSVAKIYVSLLLALVVLFTACKDDETQNQQTEESTVSFPTNDQDPETYLRSLNKQIGESPDDYTLFKDRAVVYYQLDSINKAIQNIDYAIELFRNSPELHYWRGFFAFSINDTAKAKDEYEAAIGLGSRSPESYYQLGQIYFFQGNDEEAMELYQKAAEINDQDPIYVFAQGFLEERRRKHSKALTAYQRALEIDSTFDKALIQLHDLYFNQYNSEKEAMKYIDKLISYQPSHPLARFHKGNYYLRRALTMTGTSQQDAFQDQINKAVVEYTIAINRDDNFAQACYNRGYCYFLADRHDEALSDFQKCIETNPEHPQAAFMLGSLYEYFNDFKTALKYYEQALENDPGNVDAETAVKEVKEKLG